MSFLKEYDFTDEEINVLEANFDEDEKIKLEKFSLIIGANIDYIKNLGVENYKEAFMKYHDVFLMDPSDFKEKFDKYDTADMVEKLKNNLAIIERL